MGAFELLAARYPEKVNPLAFAPRITSRNQKVPVKGSLHPPASEHFFLVARDGMTGIAAPNGKFEKPTENRVFPPVFPIDLGIQ